VTEGHVSTAFIAYPVDEGARLTEYIGIHVVQNLTGDVIANIQNPALVFSKGE
jgi:hypothetical protein